MPTFKVLSRVDAFVNYVGEVEADDPQSAVRQVWSGQADVQWKRHSIDHFDAMEMVALDDDGAIIEASMKSDF